MAAPSSQGQSTGSPKLQTVIKIAVVLAALAALVFFGRQAGDYIPRFNAWIEGLGFWAPLVFILGYAVATVAFIPGSLLTAASGAIFGIGWGALYSFLGATLGATVAFLVARYLARSAIEKKLEGQPRFAQIDRAIGRDGGKMVALMRLAPVFPFNLLNYALGLTSVKFLPYLVASLAMFPGTLLYVYFGSVAGQAVQAGGGQAQKSPLQWAMLAVGLLATILVVVMVTKKAKQAFDSAVEEDNGAEEATKEPHHG